METKIIAVGNQKGGVGKSTTIYWLASTLSIYYDKKIAVIDGIDIQQTLAKRRRFEISKGIQQFPYDIFFCQGLEQLDPLLDKCYNQYDVIFLDMPPLVQKEINAILASCDGLLVPMLSDTVDKDSTLDYLLYVEHIQQNNPEYVCYGFINRFTNSIRQRQMTQFVNDYRFELFDNPVPYAPLVLALEETYISPYDKVGKSKDGKDGKVYLEPFMNEFIHKYLR